MYEKLVDTQAFLRARREVRICMLLDIWGGVVDLVPSNGLEASAHPSSLSSMDTYLRSSSK